MPTRYGKFAKEILQYIAIGGAFTLACTSPYFAQNILSQLKKKYPKEVIDRRKFSQAFSRLKKSRLLILQEKEERKFIVQLTEKGNQKIKEFQFEDLKIGKPEKWDKIWRIVIFDIPEKKKIGREALRNKLRDLGFYQLQKSVWIFPYPCQSEIEFIIEFFDLYPYTNIIETAKIQNDIHAKKHFNLL